MKIAPIVFVYNNESLYNCHISMLSYIITCKYTLYGEKFEEVDKFCYLMQSLQETDHVKRASELD